MVRKMSCLEYTTKNGNIEADIHETSWCTSAPQRVTEAQYSAGAYTSARVDVLNAGASKTASQYSSYHDLASESSHVLTVIRYVSVLSSFMTPYE